ncbi:MAG: 4-alpha-glucanotransferase [Eubacteriales bacterium]|nr:4-alpha-glucanotransferase [Eubacteriales bacterium]
MKRYAGVLLSVTSLPSKHGIGCFDRAAYDFVDFLARAGQRYWQILPLGSTSYGGSDDSPYQAFSAFAGNPYMISLDELVREGVLTEAECESADFGSNPARVDFDKLHENRLALLHRAYERSNVGSDPEFHSFCAANHWWLDDYALFMALKSYFQDAAYRQWPEDIRMHWGFALDYYNRELYFDVEFQKYLQYKFDAQWTRLKAYANEKGIQIVGDIPIYVSPDGADVWAHPELFQLDGHNAPVAVAGCPPDGFAAEGQVWGSPLYRWDLHRATDYEWWVTRMWYSFKLYDVVRIDHFRGFDEYFSIPAGDKTALGGHWEQGPGMDLFNTIHRRLGPVHIIAEDLGYMTDSVRQLVRDSGYPNMKVLQFAVDPKDVAGSNEYWPHNYSQNCVVYTGTHDNETVSGWLRGLSREAMAQVRSYLCNPDTPDSQLYRSLINLAMASCARDCIIPIQDYLGLGNEARMNQPATVGKNWRWRLTPGQVTEKLAEEILAVTLRTNRANWDALPKKDAEESEE